MADPQFRPAALTGTSPRWSPTEWAIIGLLAVATLLLRGYWLSAEGFADDEIHKWLAGNRYLHGDFGGDDVEHPMVMKALIALTIALLPKSLAPETLTRMPNVLAGAVTIWAVAQLGKRLFGKGSGLIAATILALSTTSVGYGRIAKEDTLFTLFLVIFFWCFSEAIAAANDARGDAQRSWEFRGAMTLGAMFASKYQIFMLPMLPLLYLWLRLGGTAWRMSFRRLGKLALVGIAVLLMLNWALLLPSTWDYLRRFLDGAHVGDRGTSESIVFMGKLWDNLGLHILASPPIWFYFVFAGVKFTPLTVILMASGLTLALWRRGPAHRIVLLWIGFFLLVYWVMAVKYCRYFIPLLPALAVLAGHFAVELANRLRFVNARVALAALVLFVAVPEAYATVTHLPHPRLYINALGGGDSQVDYYFPHCDYFDAGVREAVRAIAASAEPGAEISTETGWPVHYYVGEAGRPDIVDTAIRPKTGCLNGRACYVITQTGRLYWHNEAALERLARRTPWTTVDVAGRQVIRVYRLDPGEALFPPENRPEAGKL
jgi:4-amino-4-deoxy-L-arabinose transferase-like glycosyltransferase